MIKTLLIDIERAPATAVIFDLKTKYVPLSHIIEDDYMLCFAAKWLGDKEMELWSDWDHGQKMMVERAWQLLDEADAVITYNGNGYDLKHFNTEFLVHRLGPPTPYHSIDLYRTVTSTFRVLSKSMKHMLYLLSLESKMDNEGMPLWIGCMNGEAESHGKMEEYNFQDVEVMESLYDEMLPWISNHPNVALWMPEGDEPKCPRCGSEELRFKGYKRTQVLSYKQYLCKGCGYYPRERYAEESGANKREDVLR